MPQMRTGNVSDKAPTLEAAVWKHVMGEWNDGEPHDRISRDCAEEIRDVTALARSHAVSVLRKVRGEVAVKESEWRDQATRVDGDDFWDAHGCADGLARGLTFIDSAITEEQGK